MSEEVLTIEQVCDWLKLSKNQLYAMLRTRGRARMRHPIPCIRINSNVRFLRSQLDQWIAAMASDEQEAV